MKPDMMAPCRFIPLNGVVGFLYINAAAIISDFNVNPVLFPVKTNINGRNAHRLPPLLIPKAVLDGVFHQGL